MKNSNQKYPKYAQKIKYIFQKFKIPSKVTLIILGIVSTIWFLIRVIPKPSRASYPCMQVASPIMANFILYILSITGSFAAYKWFKYHLAKTKYINAFLLFFVMIIFFAISFSVIKIPAFANIKEVTKGDFPPNAPIGIAQGIHPGRVVWVWDSDATNENCTNFANLNGVLDSLDDAWLMAKNNDPVVIDSMLFEAITNLVGVSDNSQAWDSIFTYFNNKHGNGNVGYTAGEKVFIKINATSTFGNAGNGSYNSDLSMDDHGHDTPFCAETNPYVVLSMLRQLVNIAGISEENIIVGDPMKNIYKEFYELWYNEFPNITYLGNDIHYTGIEDLISLGRTPVSISSTAEIVYSDLGTVMPNAITDHLYSVFEEADYLINIPTLKAHACAGITLAAKNHYGSHTRQIAMHLHKGLLSYTNDIPDRLGYHLYRSQVDLLMHDLLGGNTLFVLVDGLYPGEEAISTPFKWESLPFDNDWCSSVFISLDPVAIESVCHDFLRTEHNGELISECRPNWDGVDDYLHQAADSSNWPDGIIYDPNDNGILIASLGVHEHWNDSINKQYTRDLGIGDGIELIKILKGYTGINEEPVLTEESKISFYPNPANDIINVKYDEEFSMEIFDITGKSILTSNNKTTNISHLNQGNYIIMFKNKKGKILKSDKLIVR
ncbi:MAG: DUF362 domain-containing protein [Bacteroidales bacterium]|nr:DUF362 domain-containing protein [Bacteroidales bacterium]